MSTLRGRRWCFTLNNYDTEGLQQLRDVVPRLARYIIFGREVSPTTGTPHLQGYLEVGTAVRRSAVSTLLVAGAHVELAVADAQVNRQYCIKDGDYEEFGSVVTQGKRSDLAAAATMVVEFGLKRVAEEMPTAFVKYHKGLQALRTELSIPRNVDEPPVVEVHWGKAGAGKTKWCSDKCGAARTWWHVAGDWFNGYDNHEYAILDDMPANISFRLLLKVLDRYPLLVPVKGGFVPWCPKYILLTSNLKPIEWYKEVSAEEYAALERRFTSVKVW